LTRNAHTFCDHVYVLAGGDRSPRGFEIGGIGRFGPSTEATLRARCDETGHRALTNEVALEVCESARHHVEEHAAEPSPLMATCSRSGNNSTP
jgi:hypothetical protein